MDFNGIELYLSDVELFWRTLAFARAARPGLRGCRMLWRRQDRLRSRAQLQLLGHKMPRPARGWLR